MSHTLSSSPSSDGRSNFFAHSDDDADTASQRSISLSSNPSSPKALGALSGNLMTPVKNTFSPSPPKLPEHTSDVTSDKELTNAHEGRETDHETSSVGGTGTSGPPSAVTSLKFDDDSMHPSSTSSRTSLDDHEDTHNHKHDAVASPAVETTYPLPPLVTSSGSGHATDRGGTDQESEPTVVGRTVRPESILVEPPDGPLVLGIALVDFNHVVGPRVEFFEGSILEDEEIIKILPFLALPDGAHLSSEDYSYFHLVPSGPKPTTIFGISCNRQIAASELLSKGEDVTRSMVQKAVVVLTSRPVFGAVRDKLGVVTNAYFNQRDFRETSLLTSFVSTLEKSLRGQLTESSLYMGTSIRELVHKFRHRTLILLKTLMLQKKIMFFGHPVDRLCTYQYSLVSLIPLLMQTLEDCASPPLAARAPTLSRPTSLRTSDRKSLLTFVGLPLDIFGKDAFFQPYLPLQQVDIASESNSWLCGCTNSIVYQQSKYDLLVNIETNVFEFQNPKLEKLVSLTPADRKWIDDLVKDVNESWSESDPTRPSGMQFKGSDDYLRIKFEEYVSAALASIKYSAFLAKTDRKGGLITEGFAAESQHDFNPQWIAAFKATQAFETWERVTDPMLFDIVEPRHPCIDKPTTVADIGLRLTEGVRELKIDQQLAPTREALSSVFSSGSANFFKAVDGIKGRWPVSRTASTASLQSASSSSASNAATPTAASSSTTSTATPAAPSSSTSSATTPTAPSSSTSSAAPPTAASATDDHKSPAASVPQRPSIRTSISSTFSMQAPVTSPIKETAQMAGTAVAQAASDAKITIGAWGSSVGSFFSSRAGRFSFSRSSISSMPVPEKPPAPPPKISETPEPVTKPSGNSGEQAHSTTEGASPPEVTQTKE